MAESEVDVPFVPDEEAQLAVDVERQEIRNWGTAAKGRPLTFLVAGAGGVGKSALSNNLLGLAKDDENAAVEGRRGHNTKITTTSVNKHELHLRRYGIDVVAFDTPGFQDPNVDDADIITEMVQKTGKRVDVFLYCASLRTRISRVEHTICKVLTKSFDASVWKKAIFVLTWANDVEVEQQPADEYERTIADCKEELRKAVRMAGVPDDIVADIPICTAGYTDPSLKQMQESNKGSWQDCMYTEIIRRADPNIVPALLEFKWGEAALDFTFESGLLASIGVGAAVGVSVDSSGGPVGVAASVVIGGTTGLLTGLVGTLAAIGSADILESPITNMAGVYSDEIKTIVKAKYKLWRKAMSEKSKENEDIQWCTLM